MKTFEPKEDQKQEVIEASYEKETHSQLPKNDSFKEQLVKMLQKQDVLGPRKTNLIFSTFNMFMDN